MKIPNYVAKTTKALGGVAIIFALAWLDIGLMLAALRCWFALWRC